MEAELARIRTLENFDLVAKLLDERCAAGATLESFDLVAKLLDQCPVGATALRLTLGLRLSGTGTGLRLRLGLRPGSWKKVRLELWRKLHRSAGARSELSWLCANS